MREQIQINAVEAMCNSVQKCIGLHIFQRVGKTKILIDYLKKQKKQCKILIAYPDNKIKESWENEIIKWGYNNKNITFSNFSSLKKHVGIKYDFVILDEAQSLSEYEKEISSEILKSCDKMILPSGTFDTNTKNELNLWLGMEIVYEYNSEEAINAKVVADYTLYIHYVDLDDVVKKKNSKGVLKSEKQSYDDYTYIINSLKRQGKSINKMLLLNRNRISQGSIAKINYVKSLLHQYKDKRVLIFSGLAKIADDLGIASYHTKSKSKEGFNNFQEEKVNHLALVGIGKMGITYKNLDLVIMNGFTANPEEFSQICARAQILDYKNKKAHLHLICLNEPAEIKKLDSALELINKNKIVHMNKIL